MFLNCKQARVSADAVRAFLKAAGGSLRTFRYFVSRPPEIIQNHIVTILLTDDDDRIVAYGHLDPDEDGTVWLGVCVAEHRQGQGYGRVVMNKLLLMAQVLDIETVDLTVDADNIRAVQLYEKIGFRKYRQVENAVYYRLGVRKCQIHLEA